MIDYNSEAYRVGALFGSVTAGLLCGLIPLGFASRRGRPLLGLAGMIACIVSGYLGGLLLAGAVALISTGILAACFSALEASANARPRQRKRRTAVRRPQAPMLPLVDANVAGQRHRESVKLLRLLSRHDDWFEPMYLSDVVEQTFNLLQDSAAADAIEDMRPWVTGDCLDLLERRTRAAGKDSLAQIQRYELQQIQLVHFSAFGDISEHVFTALLTAERGQRSWQEFWTFRRNHRRWRLARLRSTKAADVLLQSNGMPPGLIRRLKPVGETA